MAPVRSPSPARSAAATRFAQGQLRPPNIIFILADDLGYADLSCYGRRDYQTPHLDALAAAGVRLTQGYANSCVCSATRTAADHRPLPAAPAARAQGADQPARAGPGFPAAAGPSRPCPLCSSSAGYRTALVGKWHLGFNPAAGPLDYGYDHFFGYPGGGTNYYQQPGGGTQQYSRRLVR